MMADGVETRVRPEELVLDRCRGVEHLGRDVLEGRDLTPERAEPGELDLAGPVVDDRLLLEAEVLEGGAGVGQSLRIEVVRGHGEQRASTRQQDRDQQEDDRDGDEGGADDGSAAPGRLAVEGAPMALPPRQGGLHLSPHDSIGVVNDRTGAAVPVQTRRGRGL